MVLTVPLPPLETSCTPLLMVVTVPFPPRKTTCIAGAHGDNRALAAVGNILRAAVHGGDRAGAT
jgi:hypothetical protein